MAKTIAKVYGTALAPGVSRNGRLYTREVIARAVERAQSRLAEGEMTVREMDGHPMAQRTHHAAEDDTTRIVGRVARLWLADDGRALFEAHVANTKAGQTIAELIDTSDGEPAFVRGVSIRGAWLGETYRTHHEGRLVETADDLEIDGLDYTHKPGVPGAVIDRVERTDGGGPRETTPDGRTVIYESIQEVRVANAVEETTPAPAGAVQENTPPADPVYADNGYHGEKRWPLGSLQETAAAWEALQDPRTVADYSSRQLKRMKQRVRRALDEHGVTETAEGYLLQAAQPAPAVAEGYGSKEDGGFSVRVNKGPLEVQVGGYCLDPQDLQLIARRAMDGAMAALAALDLPADPFAREGGLPDDNQMESGFVPFKKGQNKPGEKPADDEDDVEDGDETESGFVPFKKGQNSPADQKKGAQKKGDDEDNDPKSKKDDKGKKPWESAGSAAVTETGTANTTQEDPAVSETQNPGAAPAADPTTAAPAAVTLTAEQFAQLLSAAQGAPAAAPAAAEAPAETAAPAAGAVTETTDEKVARLVAEGLAAAGVKAPVQETEEQRIQRLVDERLQAAIGQHVAQNGPPARKGLVETSGHRGVHGGTVTQAAGAAAVTPEGFDRPLHTLSPEEWERTAGVAIERHVMGSRSVWNQG